MQDQTYIATTVAYICTCFAKNIKAYGISKTSRTGSIAKMARLCFLLGMEKWRVGNRFFLLFCSIDYYKKVKQ